MMTFMHAPVYSILLASLQRPRRTFPGWGRPGAAGSDLGGRPGPKLLLPFLPDLLQILCHAILPTGTSGAEMAAGLLASTLL